MRAAAEVTRELTRAGYRHHREKKLAQKKLRGGDPIENSRQRYQGPSYGYNAPR